MSNPRKRKMAIANALRALADAETPVQASAIRESLNDIVRTPDSEVESADWLQKKAEEIAKVLGQPDPEEALPPETVKESVPAKTTKKKKTKKKVNRGRKAASRKSKN
jgi:hypothetical protein